MLEPSCLCLYALSLGVILKTTQPLTMSSRLWYLLQQYSPTATTASRTKTIAVMSVLDRYLRLAHSPKPFITRPLIRAESKAADVNDPELANEHGPFSLELAHDKSAVSTRSFTAPNGERSEQVGLRMSVVTKVVRALTSHLPPSDGLRHHPHMSSMSDPTIVELAGMPTAAMTSARLVCEALSVPLSLLSLPAASVNDSNMSLETLTLTLLSLDRQNESEQVAKNIRPPATSSGTPIAMGHSMRAAEPVCNFFEDWGVFGDLSGVGCWGGRA